MRSTREHLCPKCEEQKLHGGRERAAMAVESIMAEQPRHDFRAAGNLAVQRWAKNGGEKLGGAVGQDAAAPAPAPAPAPAAPAPAAAAPAGPAGGLTINVVQAAKNLTSCGAAEFKVHWNVPAASDGWVVQHISFTPTVTDGTGAAVAANNAATEYWEGWQVAAGKVYIGFATGGAEHVADTFRTLSEPGNRGFVQVWGNVKFMPGYNVTDPPWSGVPEAGSLPATRAAPAGWSDGDTLTHSMTVAFDCTDPDPAQHSQGVSTTP